MRIALHSVLTEGAVEDYLLRHARVPDELVALFDRAGITDWTIWRSGDRLFHIVDCDDWERAMSIVTSDIADARWQSEIGRYVAGYRGPEGAPGYEPLAQVWSLDQQRSS